MYPITIYQYDQISFNQSYSFITITLTILNIISSKNSFNVSLMKMYPFIKLGCSHI